MLNSLDAQSRRDVAFACAWSADQYDVVGAICKVTAVKLTHERLVDLTDGKVEACQILVAREPGRSEEHTSELRSLKRSSYAALSLKKKTLKRVKAHTSHNNKNK